MNILGCLDRPSAGSYRVSGRDTATPGADELAALRREHFGFIFQHYPLLAELTALGNVEILATYACPPPPDRPARAGDLRTRPAMPEPRAPPADQLSVGKQPPSSTDSRRTHGRTT